MNCPIGEKQITDNTRRIKTYIDSFDLVETNYAKLRFGCENRDLATKDSEMLDIWDSTRF